MSVVPLISARSLTSMRRSTSGQDPSSKVGRGSRPGCRIDATDRKGRRGCVMNSTIVGRVRRWLLDRYDLIWSEVLHFGTLNPRPDDPLEVPREVSFAHVDCYQRHNDLVQVRTPGSLQERNRVERTGLPTRDTKTAMTCCHGVSTFKSTVTSLVPVIPLTQRKRASIYLMLNVPFDAKSMPAAMTRTSVLIGNINQDQYHSKDTHKR